MLLVVPVHPVKAGLIGDLNGDGKVDIYDMILMADVFGMTNSSVYWNETGYIPSYPNFAPYMADLNGDGVIDIFDVIILARNFGT
jgi:hypothetical protein